jgi:hypothetical protein
VFVAKVSPGRAAQSNQSQSGFSRRGSDADRQETLRSSLELCTPILVARRHVYRTQLLWPEALCLWGSRESCGRPTGPVFSGERPLLLGQTLKGTTPLMTSSKRGSTAVDQPQALPSSHSKSHAPAPARPSPPHLVLTVLPSTPPFPGHGRQEKTRFFRTIGACGATVEETIRTGVCPS